MRGRGKGKGRGKAKGRIRAEWRGRERREDRERIGEGGARTEGRVLHCSMNRVATETSSSSSMGGEGEEGR